MDPLRLRKWKTSADGSEVLTITLTRALRGDLDMLVVRRAIGGFVSALADATTPDALKTSALDRAVQAYDEARMDVHHVPHSSLARAHARMSDVNRQSIAPMIAAAVAAYNKAVAPQGEEPEYAWKRDAEATLLVMTMIGVEIPMPPTKPEHVGTIMEHRPKPGAPTLTEEIVSIWTDEQMVEAEQYAGAVSLQASDNDDVVIPPLPAHLAPYLPASPSNPSGYGGLGTPLSEVIL